MAMHVDDTVRRFSGWMPQDQCGRPLSRRLFLAGATAGAATLGLAACGGASSTTEDSPTTGSKNFPVTLIGKEGTAIIPAEPRRVITLGFQRDTDTTLALGVTPIALAGNSSFPNLIAPWVESELTEPKPEVLNTADGIPFEKIAALRPDLILATDSYELTDNYSRLAQIAPTVSYIENVNTDTWQQRTNLIGKALGRNEQAQNIINDVEAKVKQATQDHAAFANTTFSINLVIGREIYTVLGGDSAVKLLEQLGLRISPQAATQPESSTPGRALVSPENLGVLDADVLIVTYATDDDRSYLESSQLFQQLNAVKNSNYVPLDLFVSIALAFPSPLTIPYALDRTVDSLNRVLV